MPTTRPTAPAPAMPAIASRAHGAFLLSQPCTPSCHVRLSTILDHRRSAGHGGKGACCSTEQIPSKQLTRSRRRVVQYNLHSIPRDETRTHNIPRVHLVCPSCLVRCPARPEAPTMEPLASSTRRPPGVSFSMGIPTRSSAGISVPPGERSQTPRRNARVAPASRQHETKIHAPGHPSRGGGRGRPTQQGGRPCPLPIRRSAPNARTDP